MASLELPSLPDGGTSQKREISVPEKSREEEKPLLTASDLEAAVEPELRVPYMKKLILSCFLSRKNVAFAEDAEHAFRGAFFTTLAAIPVMLPKGTVDLVDKFLDMGFYNSDICTFVVFNFGRTFGEAFENVKNGLKGKIISTLVVWLLYTIFPDGVLEDSPDYIFWVGVAIGVLYVNIVLFLNLDLMVKIFAVVGFAGYWMSFLRPGDAGVKSPLNPDYAFLNDACSKSLATFTVGFFLVLLVNLVPYPQWSLDLVHERLKAQNHELIRSLTRMIDYFAQDRPNVYEKDEVIRILRAMQAKGGKVKGLLQSSWWECFGVGRGSLRRQVLNSIDDTGKQILGLISNAWTLTHAETNLSLKNAEFLRQIRPQMTKCLVCLEVLLNFAIRAAQDGELDDAEKLKIKNASEAMKAEVEELTKQFYTAREAISKADFKVLCKDIRIVQVLVFSLGQMLDEVEMLADKLSKFSRNHHWALPKVIESGGFASAFQGLCNLQYLLKHGRYVVAYLTCFTIGWYGFRDVLEERSADLAVITALLLSDHVGSAFLNNLTRIQGLVIGNVMARILGSLIINCSLGFVALHVIILFSWLSGTLFIMYHSKQFSTAGCLAAALGASAILGVDCSNNIISKSTIFDKLATNCAAVIISMLVDSVFSAGTGKRRASDQAYTALDDCWTALAASLQEILDPSLKKISFHTSEAWALLDSATSLGQEAAIEPRNWRTDWRADLFNFVISETQHLANTVSVFETVMDEDGTGAKDAAMVNILTTSSYLKSHSTILLKKIKAVQKLLSIFVHETEERFPALSEADTTYEYFSELQHLEDKFLNEEVSLIMKDQLKEVKQKLRKDRIAHLSMVLASKDRLQILLRRVQHEILQNTWHA